VSANENRVKVLLRKCREVNAINPLTREGSPTEEQILNLLDEATFDASAEMDELAAHLKRLCRIVRKRDPANPQAANALKFLRCIGQLEPMRVKGGEL
jgi:hypothetical protein